MARKTTWIIGTDPECDLVVDRPSVSWRHCQLSWRPDGTYMLDDLGSTNGTYVNGRRVAREATVRPGDAVTLGLTVPMPWPEAPVAKEPARPVTLVVVHIGRDRANDLVIDDPEVSGRHARALLAPGTEEGVVEDLGSTNGTAVDDPNIRVQRSAFTPSSTLYFGPVAVAGSAVFEAAGRTSTEEAPLLELLGDEAVVGRDESCDIQVDYPMVSGRHARLWREGDQLLIEDLKSSNGTFVNGQKLESPRAVRSGDEIGLGSYVLRFRDARTRARTPLASSEAIPDPSASRDDRPRFGRRPSLAIAAGLGLGAQIGLLFLAIVTWASGSPARALLSLTVGSFWLGLSAAGFQKFVRPGRGETPSFSELVSSLLRSWLGAFAPALLLTAVLFVLVAVHFRWPATDWRMATALGLTAMVGAAAGLSLIDLTRRVEAGVALAVLLLAACIATAVPWRTGEPVRGALARAMPLRWAHEWTLSNAGTESEELERLYPLMGERAGPTACATALAAMLIGWIYVDAVIVLGRVGSREPSGAGRTALRQVRC